MGTRCADHVTPLYPQKLALTSPTGGGRSVGIVRSRTSATEFVCLFVCFVVFVVFAHSPDYNKDSSFASLFDPQITTLLSYQYVVLYRTFMMVISNPASNMN